MEAILVDTSVWINFLQGYETKASNYLRNNLSAILIATCPVIKQEVLQGIVSDNIYNQVKSYFSQFVHLTGDGYDLAIQASGLYRKLRKEGITIRKPNDCLIACYALNNDMKILHDDKDFLFLTQHSALKTIEV